MRHDAVLGLVAVLAAAAVLALPAAPGAAVTSVYTPAGTKIGLQFVTPVDTATAAKGDTVRFKVAADVIVDRYVVIKRGATVIGTVTDVQKPGIFGKSGKAVISFLSVTAVDGKPVVLNDVIVSPEMAAKNRAGAAGASVGGAVLLGPVGLLGGALVRGGNIQVPAGSVVTQTTKHAANIKVS